MVSSTLDLKDFIYETRKQEENSLSSPKLIDQDQSQAKVWYSFTINCTKHLHPLLNFPQKVFQSQQASESRHETMGALDTSERVPKEYKHNTAMNYEDVYNIYKNIFNELSNPNINELTTFIGTVKDKVDSRDHWTQVFAYTDFSTMPVYASILALAATLEEENLSARKVFAGRCRNVLRESGIAETILDYLSDESTNDSTISHPISVAHMIACLEECKATDGYLEAALHFDQLNDTRSALACVYRNVRYRLRDNQLSELDNDLKKFDVSSAGVNVMLAVLTATAPLKSKLANRRRIFREIKAYLKKSGQLEKGLLDGLK